MNINSTNLNLLWCSIIIDHLVQRGINRFFISPGLRCAPIHYLLNKREDIYVSIVPDERSASFEAIGSIKGCSKPAVLVCTSGTAVANYFPAVIESYYDHLPLVVWTADRPFDAWDVDANQSIDQKNIYGKYAVNSLNLPNPSLDVDLFHLSSKVHYALTMLYTFSRPIHINLPLKEPFNDLQTTIPDHYLNPFLQHLKLSQTQGVHYLGERISIGKKVDLSQIQSILAPIKKPMVVVGNLSLGEDLSVIEKFLETVQCPLFIDITSSLKYRIKKENVIDYIDHPKVMKFIREDYRPDTILHLGARLVSNNYYRMLKQESIFEIQVAPTDDNLDQASRTLFHLPLTVTDFCLQVESFSTTHNEYQPHQVTQLQDHIFSHHTLDNHHQKLTHFNIANTVIEMAHNDDILYIGNSFPIRAFDQYIRGTQTKKLLSPVITHRGVSGIEGFVAAAKGAHHASKRRVILVVGDVTFMHDFSSLLYLNKNADIKIIVINNHRGGIFSTLPIKNYPQFVNPLVESPHEHNFSQLLQNWNLNLSQCHDLDEFKSQLRKTFDSNGLSLIEVQIDHQKDLEDFERRKI